MADDSPPPPSFPEAAQAAHELLPLVYAELRRMAAARLAKEAVGQTLQPTALVHEAFLRLSGGQRFASRPHFFAAAAEAMRRILIEQARRKRSQKQGGGRRVEMTDDPSWHPSVPLDELLAIDEALQQLQQEDDLAAQVAKLHLHVGLSIEEVGDALGISRASAYRQWTYARAWLRAALRQQNST